MLYGVFSDIHSNFEALKKVLDFFRKNKIQNFICCGDIVGYCPQPIECLNAIRAIDNLAIVAGNHDWAVCGKVDTRWFNTLAVEVIELVKKELSGDMLDYMANVPEFVENKEFTLVHGSPRKHLTEYLLEESQILDNLEFWKTPVCFVGHSHFPLYFEYNADKNISTDVIRSPRKIILNKGSRYILNPGSVGQPRDGNPFASCAVYDSESKSFEVFRLKYDVEKIQKLMEEKKMPRPFSERLKFGL